MTCRSADRGASSYLPASSPKRSLTLPGSTTSSGELILTPPSTIVQKIGMSGRRVLIDTSIVVDLKKFELRQLAARVAISAITVAELVKGRYAAVLEFERERRSRHLQQVEASIEALPFDMTCARAFGRVSLAVERIGRTSRGSRAVDLMIAATALAHGLPLYTLNAEDLHGLEDLVEIVDIGA